LVANRILTLARLPDYQALACRGVETREEQPVKKFAISVFLASAVLPVSVRAQVVIDMNRVTCAQYLAMPEDDSKTFSAWMSGWFNQKTGYTRVDLRAYVRNVANVKAWCQSNPKETVMAGLERAIGTQQQK
jgi:hypothetical protein